MDLEPASEAASFQLHGRGPLQEPEQGGADQLGGGFLAGDQQEVAERAHLRRGQAVFGQRLEQVASGGRHGFRHELAQPDVEIGGAAGQFELPVPVGPAPEQFHGVKAPALEVRKVPHGQPEEFEHDDCRGKRRHRLHEVRVAGLVELVRGVPRRFPCQFPDARLHGGDGGGCEKARHDLADPGVRAGVVAGQDRRQRKAHALQHAQGGSLQRGHGHQGIRGAEIGGPVQDFPDRFRVPDHEVRAPGPAGAAVRPGYRQLPQFRWPVDRRVHAGSPFSHAAAPARKVSRGQFRGLLGKGAEEGHRAAIRAPAGCCGVQNPGLTGQLPSTTPRT